jgi:hypothetical protein
MRIIVILAAASITFVASLPAVAKQVMKNTCETARSRCIRWAEQHPTHTSDVDPTITVTNYRGCEDAYSACINDAITGHRPPTPGQASPSNDPKGKERTTGDSSSRSKNRTGQNKMIPVETTASKTKTDLLTTRRTGTTAGGPIK